MTRRRLVFVASALVLAAAACRPGKVVERQPMAESLSSWRAMSVQVVSTREVLANGREELAAFERELLFRVRDADLGISIVDPPGGDLRVRVIVRSFEPGGVLEEAYVLAEVELLDVRRNAIVGRFDVKHEMPGKLVLDPEGRTSQMLRVVVKRIVDYLRDHRG